MVNLYFIPTPIENYNDMTFRGVEILKSCDLIYTNNISKTHELLTYYNIERPLYCYKEKVEEVLTRLKQQKTIAIVSEEGYSGVDEESHLICINAIQEGINVIVIPGCNYLLTGLVTSGIPCDKFFYYGYLGKDKKHELKEIMDFDKTLVFYETSNELQDSLSCMYDVLGARKAVVCCDVSTEKEKFYHINLGDELEDIHSSKKIVIVVEGAKIKSSILKLNNMSVEEHYNYYLEQGLDNKEAMKKVAKDRGVSKSDIYKVINR